MPLRRSDGQCAQLARLDESRALREVGNDEIDLRPHQVVQRGCATLVRDMGEGYLGLAGQQLQPQVGWGAVARRATAELIALGVVQKVPQGFDGATRVDHQHQGAGGQVHHRHQVLF